MKIAFFTDSYYPHLNGVTISVEEYAKALREKGHIVYIVAPTVKGYKEKDPFVINLPSFVIIHAEPKIMAPIPVPFKKLIMALSLDVDVIHAHGNGLFSLLGYEIARTRKIPFVMTFHTLHTEYTHYIFKGKILKPAMVARMLKMLAQMCDGILTPSEKMKQSLLDFGVTKEITVLPNFINLQKFKNLKSGFLHRKLKLSKDSQILLTVGRLGKEKNFGFVIKVFKKIVEKNINTHLVIIGDGPEKDNLLQLVKSFAIPNIHFAGKIQKRLMPHAYSDASAFIFASVTEVHPLVVLEAIGAGLPIIAVNDLAFSNVVKNGINGFSLPLDEDLFAKKTEEILKDSDLQKKFRMGSEKISSEGKPADELTDELINYYKLLLVKYSKRKQTKPLVSSKFIKNVQTRIRQFNKIVTIDEKQLKNMFHDTVVAVRKLRDSF